MNHEFSHKSLSHKSFYRNVHENVHESGNHKSVHESCISLCNIVERSTATPRKLLRECSREFLQCSRTFQQSDENVHKRVWSGFTWSVFACSVPRPYGARVIARVFPLDKYHQMFICIPIHLPKRFIWHSVAGSGLSRFRD